MKTSEKVATAAENDPRLQKLEDASKMAVQQDKARRERVVKGSHLTDRFLKEVTDRGLRVDENSSFHRVYGKGKSAIYIAKRGGRVDLSGFSIDHAAVEKIDEQTAKDKHLGRVRGQLNFELGDEVVVEGFVQSLEFLQAEPETEAPKPKKEEKKVATEKVDLDDAAAPAASSENLSEEQIDEVASNVIASDEEEQEEEDEDDEELDQAAGA